MLETSILRRIHNKEYHKYDFVHSVVEDIIGIRKIGKYEKHRKSLQAD